MTQRNVVNKNEYLGTGQRVSKPVWNYANRINHQNQFVPRVVLLRSGKIPVSTAKPKQAVSASVPRQVNTVRPKQSVNFPKNTFNRSQLPITRSYYAPSAQRRSLSPKRCSTIRQAVNTGKGNGITAVKPSIGCIWRPRPRPRPIADFVVVDFEPDPRVPLILGRCFLKTSHALIDVYEGEITLRVGNEAITFNLDQTSRYTADYNHMTVNKIDVIDMACDEYSQEVWFGR
ncbi:hypothetical protein Tco_1544408 [Tanacetum coccineum]